MQHQHVLVIDLKMLQFGITSKNSKIRTYLADRGLEGDDGPLLSTDKKTSRTAQEKSKEKPCLLVL